MQLKMQAQNYTMSNSTVFDCFGSLTDSNADNIITPSFYGPNEDYTFSICPSGADSIVLSFASFCSELGLDIITFYDGANTAAPIIGIPYSGIVMIPPIVATSGCLTVNFVSDASVACEGWNASWESIIDIPPSPNFAATPNPLCYTNSMVFELDQNLICGAINSSNFSLFGPSNQTISSVTAINCINGLTNTVQVNFSPGLSANGIYTIQFSNEFLDACDSLWQLTAFGSFTLNDCPLTLEILSPDTQICTGTCTTLEAVTSGGDGNYSYQWANGLGTNPGPIQVCPSNTTNYSVTVTDGSGAPAGSAQVTVEVLPQAVLPANIIVCQSDPNIDLDAIPNSGYWNGPCFGNDTLIGIFHPGWCGTGNKTIYYNNGGCLDSMTITINPMSVGATNQLVCPGSPNFNIWTNNPGGNFTGTGIVDPLLGTFDPILAGPGVHNVTYSNPPCSDLNKIITVGTATIQADDTLCSNAGKYTPTFNPNGGTWSGLGVTNWYWCQFDPTIAGAGTHDLIYTYGSCSDTLRITVLDIDAGSNQTVCPEALPFNLNGFPSGGIWSGFGIIDPILGTFDPSLNGGNNFTSWLTYSFNNCDDSLRIGVIKTVIPLNPLPSLCTNDAIFSLNANNTGITPGGGIWSGVGVVNASQNGLFDPSVAGPGMHVLTYTNNSCSDSTELLVFANPFLQDTTVCIGQSAFSIPSAVIGGFWSGSGIVNPNSGTFLPNLAGLGAHTIGYTTPGSCYYTMEITVDALPVVNINGLPDLWCFADTNFTIYSNPSNGFWSGAVQDSILNPVNVGSGVHAVNYTIGQGECVVSTAAFIQIRDTLKIEAYFQDTSVCFGSYVLIGANALGGDFLNYSYTWANNLGGSSQIVLEANSTETYLITVEDGCSTPALAALVINVFNDFELGLDSSGINCFGNDGWMRVIPSPQGNYLFIWEEDSSLMSDLINGVAGFSYSVFVTNQTTGCQKEIAAKIPSYPEIIANFLVVPTDDCIDLLNPEIYIIDQSIGAQDGIWSFGNNYSQDYIPFTSVYQTYSDTGVFTIVLSINNEGGCSDVKVDQICVEAKTRVVSSTAFSPNGDGMNDYSFLHLIGVLNPTLTIYNRWGELVFQSTEIEKEWDGFYQNNQAEIGSYTWVLDYYSIENNQIERAKGIIQLIR